MEQKSNEQKAKELGEKYIEKFFSPNEYSIERCLLDMAQWKDEQHKQEKQQWIKEACKWLEVNDSYAKPTHLQVDRLREHLNNIK